MEEKGPECSRKRGSEVRSPSRSKTLESRGHRGRSATTRRMAGNGKRVRCCGDTGLLGGSDVLRRVRAHRERRHGTTFLSCGSVSAGLPEVQRPSIPFRRDVLADWPTARWVTREGPRTVDQGGSTAMWVPGAGVEGSARVELEPETMRILSGWECNISRTVQTLNRRGGEKPRGRKSTCSIWWWQAYPSSEG
jgi:hypothetical protein